jgi:hypothetical protein
MHDTFDPSTIDDLDPANRPVPASCAEAFGKRVSGGAFELAAGTDGVPRCWATDLAVHCRVPLADVLRVADQVEADHDLDTWPSLHAIATGTPARPLPRGSSRRMTVAEARRAIAEAMQ